MSKHKKKNMNVWIETVDYPNRARGWELLDPEEEEEEPHDEWGHREPSHDEKSYSERETCNKRLHDDGVYEGDYSKRVHDKKPYSQWSHGQKIIGKGGIPGQVYRAVSKRKHGQAREVAFLELLQPSSLERLPKCSVSDRCGGCCYQTLNYGTELMLKGDQIRRLFTEAGLEAPSIRQSPLSEGYRNKMEYSFGDQEKGGRLTLGLHRPGHFYEIVPTPDCNIVPEDFNKIRKAVEFFCRDRDLSYYHKKSRQGYLRYCVIRASFSKRQLMVNLVTTSQEGLEAIGLRAFAAMLRHLNDYLDYDLVSIYHTTDDQIADAVIADHIDLLWGQSYLVEEIFGLEFHIGPFSFFQPNVEGAQALYAKAMDYVGDLHGKNAYDLYCGTGTLTQILGKQAQFVTGIEIVKEAVAKAKESAKINGMLNVNFVCGDVLEELDWLAENASPKDHPGLFMLDPPREGIHPKALEKILAAQPEKIVYISCNPRTQVRDILLFQQGGYKMLAGQAFDQFPRTKHVETVVLMSRRRD